MSIVTEFKEFAMKGNVLDMAVGVVIGGAFGKIVSSLVGDVVTPMIGKAVGGVNFKDLAISLGTDPAGAPILVKYGMFLQNIFDFVIIAAAIFMAVKAINKLKTPPPACGRCGAAAGRGAARRDSRPAEEAVVAHFPPTGASLEGQVVPRSGHAGRFFGAHRVYRASRIARRTARFTASLARAGAKRWCQRSNSAGSAASLLRSSSGVRHGAHRSTSPRRTCAQHRLTRHASCPIAPAAGEGAERYATCANASRVRFSGAPDAVHATSSSMRMPPYGCRRRTTSQAM